MSSLATTQRPLGFFPPDLFLRPGASYYVTQTGIKSLNPFASADCFPHAKLITFSHHLLLFLWIVTDLFIMPSKIQVPEMTAEACIRVYVCLICIPDEHSHRTASDHVAGSF